MKADTDGRLRAYLDDELPPDVRAEVKVALDASASLRARLSELRELGEHVDHLLDQAAEDDEAIGGDWERFVAGSRPRRRRGVVVAIAAAAALAAAALVLFWVRAPVGAAREGSAVATSRTALQIGERAVAVAEAGADLSWNVEVDGDAAVRQSGGAVFYRVNAGGTFEVQTPAGRVDVTGTCFTVEIVPMREWMKEHRGGVAVGTALGAALMLTVHEGSVVFANDHGQIEVEAGERASATADGPPRHDEPQVEVAVRSGSGEADTVASLRARIAADQRRIAQLESEAAKTPGSSPEPESRAEQIRACANAVGRPGCSLVDPDPEVLQEMARCGSIKVDAPSFLTRRTDEGFAPSDELKELVGLTEEEVEAITAVNQEFAKKHVVGLQQIVADLNGGEMPFIPEAAPPWAVIPSFTGAMDASIPQEMAAGFRRTIAEERAGQATPPSSLEGVKPLERYERLRANVGDDYEAALAGALGADRAHELRVAGDGWSSGTLFGGSCPGEDAPE